MFVSHICFALLSYSLFIIFVLIFVRICYLIYALICCSYMFSYHDVRKLFLILFYSIWSYCLISCLLYAFCDYDVSYMVSMLFCFYIIWFSYMVYYMVLIFGKQLPILCVFLYVFFYLLLRCSLICFFFRCFTIWFLICVIICASYLCSYIWLFSVLCICFYRFFF